MSNTLPVFTNTEFALATDFLSAKVATMLGRKMEEGDWDFVYCNSKNIPCTSWSNLHIDINHMGLGVEHKMLRVTKGGTILNECGTIKMHPAGTRSIRIPTFTDPNAAMTDLLLQYNEIINVRSKAVAAGSKSGLADLRIGWLLWKETLDEFLYFEQSMVSLDPSDYFAEWSITPARGARKSSRSLWIYEKNTGTKKYSITTTAGAKIQPYFQVPAPNDPNLYFFKVQGVTLNGGLVKVWLTRSTAKYIELLIGGIDEPILSKAIDEFIKTEEELKNDINAVPSDLAVPITVSKKAYEKLKLLYPDLCDELVFQSFAIHFGGAI